MGEIRHKEEGEFRIPVYREEEDYEKSGGVVGIYGGNQSDSFLFPQNDAMFIKQMGQDHYFVVEDVLLNETSLWAVWRLNKSTGNWELFNNAAPSPGEKTASGRYFYDSSKDILILDIDFSRFLGCSGPFAGTSVFSSTLSEPKLALVELDTDEEDEDPLELIRISGSPGQIQGQWRLTLGPNSYVFDLNTGGSLSVSGNVQNCDID